MSKWLCIALLLGCAQAYAGDDLLSIYREALLNNAAYQAARSGLDADRQDEDIAYAQLLPNLSFSASGNHNQTDRSLPQVQGGNQSFSYHSSSNSLILRQPLYRPQLLSRLRQTQALALASEANIAKTNQELAVNVVTSYCDALFATDQLRLMQAQRAALTAQLSAAKKSFEAGRGTLTDIDDAQSRLDLVLVQEIDATNRIADTRRALGALVGREITSLLAFNPASPDIPETRSLEDWMVEVQKHNPELESLRNQQNAAEQELLKAKGGHWPTLDLIASKGSSANDSTVTLNSAGDTKYQTTSIGLQFNLPLYSGGTVNAAVRQAAARQQQASYRYEELRRNLAVEVQKLYYMVQQGVTRRRALELAQASSARLVYSTGKGIQAGTRSAIDLVLAEQQLTTARKDVAECRYTHLVSRIRLLGLAGAIDIAEIERVNGLLGGSDPSGTKGSALASMGE